MILLVLLVLIISIKTVTTQIVYIRQVYGFILVNELFFLLLKKDKKFSI